jgi:hypothetical protein
MRRLTIAAALLATATAHAGGGSFGITRYVIAGGGGTSSGGAFTLHGTVGQAEASTTPASGAGWVLAGGFWFPIGAVPCPADLDGDGAVGGSDLAILLAAWGKAPGSVADLDADGEVGGAVLAILLAAWGPC